MLKQRPNWIGNFFAVAVDQQGCAVIIFVLVVPAKVDFANLIKGEVVKTSFQRPSSSDCKASSFV